MNPLGMDVLIRDLPDEVHAELVRRAAAKDMSLRKAASGLIAVANPEPKTS